LQCPVSEVSENAWNGGRRGWDSARTRIRPQTTKNAETGKTTFPFREDEEPEGKYDVVEQIEEEPQEDEWGTIFESH
jgi:hypothetical protein